MDTDITDALKDDFVKSGKFMVATANTETVNKLAEVIYNKGATLQSIGNAEEAVKFTGEEIPKFENGNGKPTPQYSLGTPMDSTEVTKADLESLPLVKKVTGRSGDYRVHFRNGISVPLKTMRVTGPDAYVITPEGERLVKKGWYDKNDGITITQYGDKHTASHEMYHFAEAVG
ncbi:hypothetical protein MHBO_004946, partial [Bonamia ostreae]